MTIETFKIKDQRIFTIDQTRIPESLEYIELDNVQTAYQAIKTMIVRGAPAIGIAAAFGMALAAKEDRDLKAAGDTLKSSRPTAVNLAWAVERMLRVADEQMEDGRGKREEASTPLTDREDAVFHLPSSIFHLLWNEAVAIWQEDIAMNKAMGEHGSALIKDGMNILTHCNAGALATGGHGTALGIIRSAWDHGKKIHVYSDETRPRLQGGRLTVWELQEENIPVTMITDNMAGYLMQQGKIDCVIVGADRITQNGDVANKIGTYSVAVLAKHHAIPFYVAAPYSTIDSALESGAQIPIEQREKEEVLQVGDSPIARPETAVYNPAFDVTPANLVSAIVTDQGVFRFPYGFQ